MQLKFNRHANADQPNLDAGRGVGETYPPLPLTNIGKTLKRQITTPPENTPKRIVFDAGREKGGGSISAVAKKTGTKLNNIYMHLGQLCEKNGCKCILDGDNFEILI